LGGGVRRQLRPRRAASKEAGKRRDMAAPVRRGGQGVDRPPGSVMRH
jgi:hypothetical protein